MSENFEKIVLQKLEKLDTLEKGFNKLEKGQNEQQKFNKNVLQKLEKLDTLEKGFNKLEKGQNEQQKFNKSVLKKLDNLERNQEKFEKDLKEQKEKLDYVSDDLRSFSRHFAVFEHDFSLKVDALFEKYDTDFNQHKTFKKDIDSLKDDSFKYGVQIEHLSKKIANA